VLKNRILAIFARNILLSFMILLTLTSVISLQMQEAYAQFLDAAVITVPTTGQTVGSGSGVIYTHTLANDDDFTNATGYTIRFTGPVTLNCVLDNTNELQRMNATDLGGGTGTHTFTRAQLQAGGCFGDTITEGTYTLDIVDGTVEGAGSFPTVTDVTSVTFDFSGPTFTAALGAANQIVITWNEEADSDLDSATPWTLSGTSETVSSTSLDTSTTQTLTLSGNIADGSTVSVTYTDTAGGSDIEDTVDVGTANLASTDTQSVTGIPGVPTGVDGSSGCRGDCSAPTLGIDEQFTRVVENGFTYNGNTINVERYFTPYPLITVDVGKQNKAVFKIYENSGPDNIQHFDFAFGLDVGQVMGTSNAMISWDKSHDGTETVTIVDPNNALENVRVSTSEGKCKADSTGNDCLIITVSHTFREPLDFDIVGTNVWDNRQHSWQNFYNHGVHIEGESLNPPDEYVGYCHNILCSSIKGNLIHLVETGKNTAVDEQGNTWTFDNTWIQDYVSKGKIEDPMTSQLYDRNHVKYNTYKQGQELVASSLFETYYKTSVSDEPDFAEIDDIKLYEFSEAIDTRVDLLQAKMYQEDIRAQKYLEEMFAKMYPGLVSEEIDDIKLSEFSETIDTRVDPVLQAKMLQAKMIHEDFLAQKYLEEMFAKMYPGKVYDSIFD